MAADKKLNGTCGQLTETAARNLSRLMAIKDEFEVARLFSDGSFQAQLQDQFESWDRLEFHLAPPVLAKRDDQGPPEETRLRPVHDETLHGSCILARSARLGH